MRLNFRAATDRQLNDIVHVDDEAPLKYKLAAQEEMERRQMARMAVTKKPAIGRKTVTYVP